MEHTSIIVTTKHLCQFNTFEEWKLRNKRLDQKVYTEHQILFLDNRGHLIITDKDFKTSETLDLLPIKAFVLVRSSELAK